MATAIVAGIAALVRNLNPDLSGPGRPLLKETARAPQRLDERARLGDPRRRGGRRPRPRDRPPRPTSRLRAPRSTRRRAITLRWSGNDTSPENVTASGIDRYEIWRSVDGLAPVRIFVVRGTAKRLRVRPGRRYAFFTVAVDGAGNREAPPRRRRCADASAALRRATDLDLLLDSARSP